MSYLACTSLQKSNVYLFYEWHPSQRLHGQLPCDLDCDLHVKKENFLCFVATGDIVFYKHVVFFTYF